MFGINDFGIVLGYLLAILGLIACVVYGLLYWNKGMESSVDEIQKDLEWEEKDKHFKSDI